MVKYFWNRKNLKACILHVSGGIEPPNILSLLTNFSKMIRFLWIIAYFSEENILYNSTVSSFEVEFWVAEIVQRNFQKKHFLKKITIFEYFWLIFIIKKTMRFLLNCSHWPTYNWAISDFLLKTNKESLIAQLKMGYWFQFSENITDSDLESTKNIIKSIIFRKF